MHRHISPSNHKGTARIASMPQRKGSVPERPCSRRTARVAHNTTDSHRLAIYYQCPLLHQASARCQRRGTGEWLEISVTPHLGYSRDWREAKSISISLNDANAADNGHNYGNDGLNRGLRYVFRRITVHYSEC